MSERTHNAAELPLSVYLITYLFIVLLLLVNEQHFDVVVGAGEATLMTGFHENMSLSLLAVTGTSACLFLPNLLLLLYSHCW